MVVREGVTKFEQEFTRRDPLPWEALAGLDAWRSVLYDLDLIGQDPARYEGAGFGNASERIPPLDAPAGRRAFVVTGTQTGGAPRLGPEHYTLVARYDAPSNRVWTEGPVKASSESMTHGAVYDADPDVRSVLHAHSPHIWHAARALGVPVTRADVPYGTPEMADEVHRLFRESDVSTRKVFAMGGHEDGVIAFGASVAEAGMLLVAHLARAYALRSSPPRSG